MSEILQKTSSTHTAEQAGDTTYLSKNERDQDQPTIVTLPDGREMTIDPELFDGAMQEEPQMVYTESNPDGTCTPQQYTEQLRWRVGNCGHALDVIKDKITNESDAAKWIELKNAIAAAKNQDDPHVLVDITKELEKPVAVFVFRHDFDQDAYQRVSNKV